MGLKALDCLRRSESRGGVCGENAKIRTHSVCAAWQRAPRNADGSAHSHDPQLCTNARRTSSVVGTSFIFLTATRAPVFLSRALQTEPYAPSPVRLINSYFCSVGSKPNTNRRRKWWACERPRASYKFQGYHAASHPVPCSQANAQSGMKPTTDGELVAPAAFVKTGICCVCVTKDNAYREELPKGCIRRSSKLKQQL